LHRVRAPPLKTYKAEESGEKFLSWSTSLELETINGRPPEMSADFGQTGLKRRFLGTQDVQDVVAAYDLSSTKGDDQ
jgi:hypothetical protein